MAWAAVLFGIAVRAVPVRDASSARALGIPSVLRDSSSVYYDPAVIDPAGTRRRADTGEPPTTRRWCGPRCKSAFPDVEGREDTRALTRLVE